MENSPQKEVRLERAPDADARGLLSTQTRRVHLPPPETLDPQGVAAAYENDWSALVGDRGWVVWRFIERYRGFSEHECDIIAGVKADVMEDVVTQVTQHRKRVKVEAAKGQGLPSGEKFFRSAFDAVVTRLGGAVAEGQQTSQRRVEAAGVIGDLFGSMVLADVAPSWRDMEFGAEWDSALFEAIGAVLTYDETVHNSFGVRRRPEGDEPEILIH